MRVAIIHPFLFRFARGIERFTFNLSNALARQGAEVHLLTWRWQPRIQIDPLDPRVSVHLFPTSRYYAAQAIVPFYAAHLLRHPYDFVWVFFAGYGEAEALTVARRQRFGVVFHYPYAQVPHRYHEFLRFGLIRRAAQLVTVSRFVAQGVRQKFDRESVVIHHGVDTGRFKPGSATRAEVRSSMSASPTAPLIVTVAALEERKGVQWVLCALPKILRRFPEAIYLVLGDGSYRAALEQQAQELGIRDRVRFLGFQEDVIPFYQAADLSIILSRGEASSLTALESLACGLPVIAARQPPFDELIDPDDGMLVNEADEQQVANAMVALLANPSRRQKMGAAGRARMCASFGWERVAGQYVRLLESAVRK